MSLCVSVDVYFYVRTRMSVCFYVSVCLSIRVSVCVCLYVYVCEYVNVCIEIKNIKSKFLNYQKFSNTVYYGYE